jgi:cyclophilin family peptidyl-prolyl cis-trans isomerase
MKHHRLFVTLLAGLFLYSAVMFAQETKSKPPAEKPKEEKSKMTEPKGKEIAVIETNMGTIEIELFRADAPKTVDNFIGLAKKGYYNGLIFHRVIDNFMIQGGDPTGTGAGGESIYGKKFEDEISPKLKFDRAGLLAMANAGPNTNGSQFFITLVPTTWLNTRHTIFGEVVAGMDVVKAIGKVQTIKPNDKPVKDVIMKKVHMKSDTWEKAPEKKK